MLLGWLAPGVAQGAEPGDYHLIAHRGQRFNPTITENTIEAGRYAMAHGASAIEIDVMPTRDNRFLVMHDPNLGRTTTCSGAVRLKRLRWVQRNCRGDHGERIPNLGEYLSWASQNQANLLIEIKFNGKVWTDSLLDAVIARVEGLGMASRVRFASYLVSALNHIETVRPGFVTLVFKPGALSAMELIDGTPLVDQVSLCAADLTPEALAALTSAKRSAQGGVTDNAANWSAYRDRGVAEVMVNSLEYWQAWSSTGDVSWPQASGPCLTP